MDRIFALPLGAHITTWTYPSPEILILNPSRIPNFNPNPNPSPGLQLHSQVDLAVTWTATTAGRLIFNGCLRECGIDANTPCQECAELRHSSFIRNLNRPGFLRTAPGQFLTFTQLIRRVCLPTFLYLRFVSRLHVSGLYRGTHLVAGLDTCNCS
jgi:hypothetical protein